MPADTSGQSLTHFITIGIKYPLVYLVFLLFSCSFLEDHEVAHNAHAYGIYFSQNR